jgi:spermidine synthase
MATRATAVLERRMDRPAAGAMVCLGSSAVVGQIVLMRELMVVFGGNEMSLGVMLAAWLFWTAIGAAVPGRVAQVFEPRRVVALLQVAIALVLPLTVVGVRASRALFHPTPGELLGPGAMLATCFVALAAFCLISGWLFAATSRLLAGMTQAAATGTVYLLEAAGSGAGGLLAGALLLRYAADFQIAVIVGAANLLSAAFVGARTRSARTVMAACAAVFAGLLSLLSPRIETASLARLWPGLQLIESRNSVYGNLAVVEAEGQRALYENGLVSFTGGDRAAAEEAVHFALAQHPAPSSLLLIGGMGGGALGEALKHRTLRRIDAVELDPAVIAMARRYFPQPAMDDPRVRVHALDGRAFVAATTSLYDVIILNLPEPQTAQVNRFYTREFFAAAARRLNPGGVLSLGVRGAEDYISPEQAEFLACLRRTLGEVFPRVVVIPGETVHFSAGMGQQGAPSAAWQELLDRLRGRGVDSLYVSEYFLPFRMSEERARGLERDIARAPARANRDFTPAAYYFGITLWSAQYQAALRDAFRWLARVRFASVFAVTMLLAVVLAAVWHGSPARDHFTAAYCAGAMGLTAMALEILLLLGFQAIYGYVYVQLALIVAAFMAGMSVGSWWALGRRAARDPIPEPPTHGGAPPLSLPLLKRQGGNAGTLALLQIIAGAAPLAVFAALTGLREAGTLGTIAFPAMALACGALGGYQFQVASRLYFGSGEAGPGGLYAVDLLGGCVAALAISAYLIPVHGMLKTAALVAAVNVIAAAVALEEVRTKK